MKVIRSNNGVRILVDDEDYPRLSLCSWSLSSNGYAVNTKLGRMHRYLMQARQGQQIDHINGIKTDNRRGNLRFCTATQNSQNQKRHRDNTSGFKGVHWDKEQRKWRSYIQANGIRYRLGRFKSIEDAARAYDEACRKYHRAFARPNEPQPYA